jgi:hypothetical protein
VSVDGFRVAIRGSIHPADGLTPAAHPDADCVARIEPSLAGGRFH